MRAGVMRVYYAGACGRYNGGRGGGVVFNALVYSGIYSDMAGGRFFMACIYGGF